MQKVLDYIAANWGNTTRFNPVSEGTLIGLPHPYTVPCADGAFQGVYYLDTYFTSRCRDTPSSCGTTAKI